MSDDQGRAGLIESGSLLAKNIIAGGFTESLACVAVSQIEGDIELLGLQEKYTHALMDIAVGWTGGYGDVYEVVADELWLLIRATPEQRARAFLRSTDNEQEARINQA